MRKVVAWLVTACLLAGCVTVPPHSLSAQDVGSWKLVGVDGVIADNARLRWPRVEDEYFAAHVRTGPETMAEDSNGRTFTVPGAPLPMTEEVKRGARPHAQNRFAERVRFQLEPLGAAMNGQRPVKIRTTLHHLDVPSFGGELAKGVVVAVMFGAGAAAAQQKQTRLTVSTEVVDAKTGAVLLTYPEKTLVGGLEVGNSSGSTAPYPGDVVAAMLGDYRNEFGRWLVKG